MNTPCPAGDELLSYLEREISVIRASEIEEHLRECAACGHRWAAIESITSKIGADPGEFHSFEFVARVVKHVTSGTTAMPRQRRNVAWIWPIAATALAAGLVAFWVTAQVPKAVGGPSSFAARGTAAFNPDQWVSFQAFRPRHGGTSYVRVIDSIRQDDRLVFSVRNGVRGPYRFLMILGVQDTGDIFWYYPAYDDPGDNPQSVRVEPSDNGQPLGEEIRHALTSGPLRIVALFSEQPFDVAAIEQVVRNEILLDGSVATMGRIPIADTGQQSFVVRVEEKVHQP